MGYKTLMCIGGPKDGLMMDVRDRQPDVRVVIPGVALPLDDEGAHAVNTVDAVVVYRREWLRDFDGTIVEVLVASGVNNPLQRLIAGYKPAKGNE